MIRVEGDILLGREEAFAIRLQRPKGGTTIGRIHQMLARLQPGQRPQIESARLGMFGKKNRAGSGSGQDFTNDDSHERTRSMVRCPHPQTGVRHIIEQLKRFHTLSSCGTFSRCRRPVWTHFSSPTA